MKIQYFTIVLALLLTPLLTLQTFASNHSVYLSSNSITLSVGQSKTVYITDNNHHYPDYYLSGNLSNGVVVATLRGDALEIYGQRSGSVTVTVCSRYENDCDSVRVNVSGSSYYDYNNYSYGNRISLSSTNAVLTVGSSVAVTVYGNYYGNYGYGNYYPYGNYGYGFTATSSNPSVATTSLYGNTLNVYGINPGSAWINICGMGNCTTFSVTVTGSQYYNQTPYYYPYTYPPYYPYNQNMHNYWQDQRWY